jgi:hypothetical protein
MAISRHPQKHYSYVGISQIVSWTDNDKLGIIWAKEEAEKRGNKKALKELIAVGETPFVESAEQWGVLRKWQRNFNTLIYSDKDIKHPGLFSVVKNMLQSKDYSIKDIYNTFYKGFTLVYTTEFIKQLPQINFMETTKVKIPITFLHRIKDVHGKLLKAYFALVEAEKGKQLIWLEKSAHAFHPDDTKMIETYLIDELKHVDRPSSTIPC